MVHNCTKLNFAKYTWSETAVVNDNISIELNVSFSTSLIFFKVCIKATFIKDLKDILLCLLLKINKKLEKQTLVL